MHANNNMIGALHSDSKKNVTFYNDSIQDDIGEGMSSDETDSEASLEESDFAARLAHLKLTSSAKSTSFSGSISASSSSPQGDTRVREVDSDTILIDSLPPKPSHRLKRCNAFWNGGRFMCPIQSCESHFMTTVDPNEAMDHLNQSHNITLHQPECIMPFFLDYVHEKAKSFDKQWEKSGKNSKSCVEWGNASDKADNDLRQRLQQHTLDTVLRAQQLERHREAMLEVHCLFCKTMQPNRTLLFQHMIEEHGLSIGHPDNLVYVDTFLNQLRSKLSRHICIYCEKVFTNGVVLRKHMRKKKHFRINPDNRNYDQFYIVNYLEPGNENDKYRDDDWTKEEEWSDWEEIEPDEATVCLFDEEIFATAQEADEHMKSVHGFNLQLEASNRDLDSYHVIRFINYVRRSTSELRCFYCQTSFPDTPSLWNHVDHEGHVRLPDTRASFWNDPQYLFPFYEEDPLLMYDFGVQ